MADKTETIYVKVETFNPATREMMSVENATLLCEHDGALWNPDLSDGTATTNADGLAEVEITYDEDDENSLNPFFTITIPVADRTVPSGAAADLQFELPEEWETRHHYNRRIPRISDHADPTNPLTIFVGFNANIQVAYPDFNSSHKGNPRAIPEKTARMYLADYDSFIFDFLNPDDTLEGFAHQNAHGMNKIIAVGDEDSYDYFDIWPTQASALDAAPTTPKATIDPPKAPVARLGGYSFTHTGPLAVDARGFVFMVDGDNIERFYPDGTWCEHIALVPGAKGITVDQYCNLFVADTNNNQIIMYAPLWLEATISGNNGRYRRITSFGTAGSGNGQFDTPQGLCVVPNPIVEDHELLAVADTDNHRIQVFRIEIPIPNNRSIRGVGSISSINLTYLTEFGQPGSGSSASASTAVNQEMWEPVDVCSDWQKHLYVCDKSWHRVSRWEINAAGTAYTHLNDWGDASGTSSSANGEFDEPVALACDSLHGYLYVGELGNNRYQRINASSGAHLLHWNLSLASASTPSGLAVDMRSNVFAADSANVRVVRGTVFDASGAATTGTTAPTTVGAVWTPVTEDNYLTHPGYCYRDADKILWVSDAGKNRVIRFEESATGELTQMPAPPFAGLNNPCGLFKYENDEFFVVDSGNHQVKRYDPALAHLTDIGTGTQGSGDDEFDSPKGMCVVRQSEPVIYVADTGNDRIKLHKLDGSYITSIESNDGNALGGGNALQAPQDVCADSEGNLYIADTNAAQILHYRVAMTGPVDTAATFVRSIQLSAVLARPSSHRPTGIVLDHDGKLLVTDQANNTIIRMEADGDLLAYWDMDCFVRQADSRSEAYRPELARWLYLDGPTRAILDDKGLLVITDTQHHQLRLLRAYTHIATNLFELGQGLFDRNPDISFRAKAQNDLTEELGLEVDVNHEFITEPDDDVSTDQWKFSGLLHSEDFNSEAVNVLKVARFVQQWTQQHSRMAEPDRRWGNPDDPNKLSIDIDAGGSFYFLEVNLGDGTSGRGSDGWDDSVVAHEMGHWIFTVNTYPYPILPLNPWRWHRMSLSHTAGIMSSYDQALSEGWGNYIELFWGGEFARSDALIGFPMDYLNGLVEDGVTRRVSVYGGFRDNSSVPLTYLTPTFDEPGRGLINEGHFANCMYQIHRMLSDSDIMFSDSSCHWHGYNFFVSDTTAQRYSDTVWRALQDFQDDPPFLDGGTTVFLRKVLSRFYSAHPDLAQYVQSLYELNNLHMPQISLSKGTSTTNPSNDDVDDEIEIEEATSEDIIIHVQGASGESLAGYNLKIEVNSGSSAHYSLNGAAPAREHGRVTPSPIPANTMYQVTNANGIVNLQISPAASTGGNREQITISYQPDFDHDASFALPEAGDSLPEVYRKLYLHHLRGAVKTWGGVGNNFGAIVSKRLDIEIESP